MNKVILNNWENRSAENRRKYKQLLQRTDQNSVLKALPKLHEEAFEKIDCMKCENC